PAHATVVLPMPHSPLLAASSDDRQLLILPTRRSSDLISSVRADNVYLDGTDHLSVSIASTSGGNYEALTPVGTVNHTVVDDTDSASKTLRPNTARDAITEGGSSTYTLTLGAPVSSSPL